MPVELHVHVHCIHVQFESPFKHRSVFSKNTNDTTRTFQSFHIKEQKKKYTLVAMSSTKQIKI